MATLKNMLPALIALASITIIVVGAVSQFAFNNNGSVATIEVTGYLNPDGTGLLTDLEWDPIPPGDNDTRVIYVISTGTIPAALNLTTADWSSSNAEANVTLTWNLEGTVIQPDAVLEATLTLAVAEDVEDLTTFSFTAIINAEEA